MTLNVFHVHHLVDTIVMMIHLESIPMVIGAINMQSMSGIVMASSFQIILPIAQFSLKNLFKHQIAMLQFLSSEDGTYLLP